MRVWIVKSARKMAPLAVDSDPASMAARGALIARKRGEESLVWNKKAKMNGRV